MKEQNVDETNNDYKTASTFDEENERLTINAFMSQKLKTWLTQQIE